MERWRGGIQREQGSVKKISRMRGEMRMERYQGAGRRDGGIERDVNWDRWREREREKEGYKCAVWSEGDGGSGVCVWGGREMREKGRRRGRGCMHRHVNNVRQQRTRCAHRGDNPEGYI